MIKNVSGEIQDIYKYWEIDEEYIVPDNLRTAYSSSVVVLQAILNGILSVNSEDGAILDKSDAIDYLKNNVIEITSKSALPVKEDTPNDRTLRPYPPIHKHIDSSQQIFEITLSNKQGDTYTYSCSVNPAYYDCIFQNHSEIRDGVLEVDTVNHTITTFGGKLQEGTAKLSKPVVMETYIDGDFPVHYLYGCFFSVKRYGDDDTVRMQIVDKDGVGVSLGWYTQEQFDAMGEYVFSEYDEGFSEHLEKMCYIETPRTEGMVPGGMYPRLLYYPKDVTKTDIDFKADLNIEVDS